MSKNPFLALIIGIIIPGFGHLYLGRNLRAFIYFCSFFGLILLCLATRTGAKEVLAIVVVIWFVNLTDLIVTLIERRTGSFNTVVSGGSSSDVQSGVDPSLFNLQSERFYTMVSTVIPGLGHFQMGLMQRGLSFLISFFGLLTMIVFVSVVTHLNGLLVFLLALPVIWLYNLFDTIQLLHRKQAGEILQDRTIYGDFEESQESGKKSKTLAMILSVFPGAGHMYLGLQQRGLQLMAGFLFSFYILDALRLSIFLFMIPILWFYSMFDAMQQVSKHGAEEVKDIPVIDWLKNHQKWIGIGLLALGVYYLFDQFVLGLIQRIFPEVQIYDWFHQYFQVFVVSTLLIAGGFRLLTGSRTQSGKSEDGK